MKKPKKFTGTVKSPEGTVVHMTEFRQEKDENSASALCDALEHATGLVEDLASQKNVTPRMVMSFVIWEEETLNRGTEFFNEITFSHVSKELTDGRIFVLGALEILKDTLLHQEDEEEE